MRLKPCPGCGQQVSKKAYACPGCGHPIKGRSPGKRGTSILTGSTVFIRRWGEAIFPVDVKITFTDEAEVAEKWDGRERWKRFDYMRAAKVARVEVDPEHKLVLDVNYTNNSWLREPRTDKAAIKWAAKWAIWLQSMMEFFAFFS